MPSTSKKQHNFMEMVAHNPAMAKKVGVPQSVGKDFAAADKGKKFAGGGLNADINKQKTHHTDGGVPYHFNCLFEVRLFISTLKKSFHRVILRVFFHQH